MEKISKEGKNISDVFNEILEENNLNQNDVIYTSTTKKGKLFKGDSVEVIVFKKEELISEAKEYLKELVTNLGLEINFELKTVDDRTIIKMYSNNNPILIGKNGNTIKALEEMVHQYLLNKYNIYFKVGLDVENYREKKVKYLEREVLKLAKEVRNTKNEIKLDNMSSYERRIVHNVLTDFKGIKTESEGEEPNRHVVIKPI